MKFVRNPVIVDAVQWVKNGDNPAVEYYSPKGITAMIFQPNAPLIRTKTGMQQIHSGDWVITDPDGSYSLCKPDVFDSMYYRYQPLEQYY